MLKNPMIDASRVALLGYCFGGTVGIEMAYAGGPMAATITIHGSFREHAAEDAKNIKGKVLILHGAEDQVAPLASVDKVIAALRKAKVDFQYELYSGADHGFSTPQNAAEERANVQSIASSTRYLKEVFGR
jgi:dienelactone hydrolase